MRRPAAPTFCPANHALTHTAVALLLQGGTPEGIKFVDTEEEWVVDKQTGQGAWLPVNR
jgi:hypothetical protein